MLKVSNQLLGHLFLNLNRQQKFSTYLRKNSNKKETNIKRGVGATRLEEKGNYIERRVFKTSLKE